MSVEDIKSKLPIKIIPIIIGDPTYKAINELREALYENAADIHTKLGEGGRNGHVNLITDTEVYTNLYTTSYTIPTDLGPYAKHGSSDAAAAQANSKAIHKGERRL